MRTRTTGRAPASTAAWLLALAACSACASREARSGGPAMEPPPREAPADVSPAPEAEPAASPQAPGPEAPPATGAPAAGTEQLPEGLAAYDLVALAPLAEVAAPGLRIDFGAGATAGYALGRWRTGWGRDGESEGRTVTVVARSPVRLYLPADAVRGTVMRVVARSLSGRRVTAEIDGETLGGADLSTTAWATADFAVPDALAGVVTLKLDFRGTGRDPQLGRGAALVDRIDFLTPEQAAQAGGPAGTPPLVAVPRSDAAPGSLVQAPGTTVRFHLYVPEAARLRLTPSSDGPAVAAVRAVRDGGEPLDLLAEETLGATRVPRDIDLAALAGEAVRLELSVAEGGSPVRWVEPRVTVADRGGPRGPERSARNLVVLLVDTLRWDKLTSLDPRTEVRADNLQRWATEGTSFTRALAQENWTKPSVATLLTGLYPSSHGAQSERSVLPAELTMLSELLQDQGFVTGCFIANGYVSESFGFRQGWGSYKNYVRSGLPNRAQHVFEDVAAWIGERAAGERFFLFVQTIDPHVPYIPPREYLELYDPGDYEGPVKGSETAKLLERVKTGQVALTERDRRRLEALYDGEISYHDAHAPLLYDALARAGLLDDTLVVVTADHGEEFFEHGSVGHGHSLYEELIHVPLFLRLPGAFAAGAEVDAVVGLVDVLPTALDALGLPPLPAAQGRSLLPLAAGSATGAEVSFTEFLEGQRAATGERYKLIQRGYRPILYDLRSDPGEERDLAAEAPIALRTMMLPLAAYLEWQERAGREEELPRPAPDAEIDPDLEAQLRALGYLGGPQ